MQLALVAASLVGGVAIAGLAIWAAVRYARAPAAAPAVEHEIVWDEPPRAKPVAVRPSPAPQAPPPPASPRSHAERAPAMLLTPGVALHDAEFSRRPTQAPGPAQAPATPARPPMRTPPPMKTWAQQVKETTKPEVPTEWARRQVGPVEPGRVAGACGGCGARLSVSDARPLRIACPVCGRTKLVA